GSRPSCRPPWVAGVARFPRMAGGPRLVGSPGHWQAAPRPTAPKRPERPPEQSGARSCRLLRIAPLGGVDVGALDLPHTVLAHSGHPAGIRHPLEEVTRGSGPIDQPVVADD